uniref:Uncharacterized protein n=1 Tax=Aegilops tauschii subsp. strangulata TaxID=200361 RepID=A0A453RRG1_AEGTS
QRHAPQSLLTLIASLTSPQSLRLHPPPSHTLPTPRAAARRSPASPCQARYQSVTVLCPSLLSTRPSRFSNIFARSGDLLRSSRGCARAI